MNKERIADTLSLPKDVVFGSSIITITGSTQAYIQNFTGIIEYNEKTVKIIAKTGKITIRGTNLQIEYFTCDDILVKGIVMEVIFDSI